MRSPTSITLVLALAAFPVSGATVLFCPFDSLDGWALRSVGATNVGVAVRGVAMSSHRGTVFLTRELPLDAVRGCRVAVSCFAKSERVLPGLHRASTAKVHLAVKTPSGIQHRSARLSGTSGWHRVGFAAFVPEDAQQVRLNVGMEACLGKAFFDRLIVRNNRRGVHRLDLLTVANAEHRAIALPAFPEGHIEWDGIPFEIMRRAESGGPDCFRPPAVDSARSRLPVNASATAIHILHGLPRRPPASKTPCAVWTATLADGHKLSLQVFEGRQVGVIGQTQDLANWRVAWTGRPESGQAVTFGVTKWPVYSPSPILSLSCRARRGASPVVLAVTIVDEPPDPDAEESEEGDVWIESE